MQATARHRRRSLGTDRAEQITMQNPAYLQGLVKRGVCEEVLLRNVVYSMMMPIVDTMTWTQER